MTKSKFEMTPKEEEHLLGQKNLEGLSPQELAELDQKEMLENDEVVDAEDLDFKKQEEERGLDEGGNLAEEPKKTTNNLGDVYENDLDIVPGTDGEGENRTAENIPKQQATEELNAQQKTEPDANKNIPLQTQTNKQKTFDQEDLELNPTKQELNESENLHNKSPDKQNLDEPIGPQAAEYDPKYDDRYKTSPNADSRQAQNDDGGDRDGGGGGGYGGGNRQGGQGQGDQGDGDYGGGGGYGGGNRQGGQGQGDHDGYDGNNYGNRSHRPNDEEGGGGGGYAGEHNNNNHQYDNADNAMSSNMLDQMQNHGGDSNEPPTHANNMQAGWNSELFSAKLEAPLIGQANIDNVISAVSSSLDSIGLISLLNKENSFSQDVAAIGDGTILKPAENVAQQETQNLTFEGLQTQLELNNLPKQLTDVDSFGGLKHGAEGQSAEQTAIHSR